MKFGKLAAAAAALAALAAPSTAGAVTVPASIPSDCSADVQDQLTAFIRSVPDGSTVDFPASRCYRASDRIEVVERTGLTIDGNGSEFRTTAPNSGCHVKPNWLLLRNRNVTLRDLKIAGNFKPGSTPRSASGVSQFTVSCVGNQFNPGIGVYGGSGVTVADADIREVFGDGVLTAWAPYIDNRPDSTPGNAPADVRVERVRVRTAARMCVAPTTVDGLQVLDSHLSECWYGGIDAELDSQHHPLRDVEILRNTLEGFSLFAIAIPVAANEKTENFEIRHNLIKGSPSPDAYCNNVIDIGIYPTNPATLRNVLVENNTFEGRRGHAVALDHVVGGSVRDNRDLYEERNCGWPNGPVPFAKLTNSSGVTVANNTPSAPGATLTPPDDPPVDDPPEGTVPAPANLTVRRSELNVWNAVASWSHPGADEYVVYLDSPNFSTHDQEWSRGPNTTQTLFGLRPDWPYTVHVVAVKNGVRSQPSERVQVPRG